MEIVGLLTIEEAVTRIQSRINEIIKNNDQANYEKLPGLIEALKLILDCKKTEK
ncbi:hypothetical protein [Neobacillus cucumis]|uniref:hypothetical protein n=1 Tax=Neobacillus cucumis TaxID=1740721 RepID=UPI001964C99E|nr:hypothetical protein [Neobacillus cucumis]MBM7652559.1 hypothetical protein [Neobacillus cucumis]